MRKKKSHKIPHWLFYLYVSVLSYLYVFVCLYIHVFVHVCLCMYVICGLVCCMSVYFFYVLYVKLWETTFVLNEKQAAVQCLIWTCLESCKLATLCCPLNGSEGIWSRGCHSETQLCHPLDQWASLCYLETCVLWAQKGRAQSSASKKTETPPTRPEESSEGDKCQQPGHPNTQGILYLPEDLSCHVQVFHFSLKTPLTCQGKSVSAESLQLLLGLRPPPFLSASLLHVKCLTGVLFFLQ